MTQATDTYRVRPYARLLTMLGEQLIKNDRIALLELVKNSYDADATRVTIRFEHFGPGLAVLPESQIVIEDDGDGMSFETVRDHWLNPATDIKRELKRTGHSRTTGGRIVQGEKGIGRFAMFKLGSDVRLTTRSAESSLETVATLDIGFLDERALPTSSQVETNTQDPRADPGRPPRFLDELKAHIEQCVPAVFQRESAAGGHGTQLTIGRLRGTWSTASLRALHADIVRLQPLRGLLTGAAGTDPLAFTVSYLVNGAEPPLEDPQTRLDSLVPQAVLRVVGSFDGATNAFDLLVNDEPRRVIADSTEMRALDVYRRSVDKERSDHLFTCGSFEFEFLVFDLRANVDEARYHLNPTDKDLIKDHRIYLYRDDIRVLPYGDADDDWLQLDVIRGTVGANRVLSNDQAIGFVYISQGSNPDLRDKTNREGLIDSGAAYSDFISLLQLLINYLRREDYQRYLADSRRRNEAKDRRNLALIDERIAAIRGMVPDVPKAKRIFDDFAKAYETERRVMRERIERTEDLAGVGLSVETASHDVVASANQAHRDINLLVEQLAGELGTANLVTRRAQSLATAIAFIVSRLQDVQGLFVSSRTKPKSLNVLQYVRKIQSIYSRTLTDGGITIRYAGDANLSALTHEATLLQIFLNLIDNSVFWMRLASTPNPTITVTANAANRTVTFEDNGPGIGPLDVPYIFDPFFSGKGDEGRGLGLYISRQVARRDRLELELVATATAQGPSNVPAIFQLSLGGER